MIVRPLNQPLLINNNNTLSNTPAVNLILHIDIINPIKS